MFLGNNKNLRREWPTLKQPQDMKNITMTMKIFGEEKQRHHTNAEIQGPTQRKVDPLRKGKV